MIKLEKTYRLKTYEDSDPTYFFTPENAIWKGIFGMYGIEYSDESIKNFLKEVKDELIFLNDIYDDNIKDTINYKPNYSLWYLFIDKGLAEKSKTYPSKLTENGKELLNIINEYKLA